MFCVNILLCVVLTQVRSRRAAVSCAASWRSLLNGPLAWRRRPLPNNVLHVHPHDSSPRNRAQDITVHPFLQRHVNHLQPARLETGTTSSPNDSIMLMVTSWWHTISRLSCHNNAPRTRLAGLPWGVLNRVKTESVGHSQHILWHRIVAGSLTNRHPVWTAKRLQHSADTLSLDRRCF